MTEIRIHPVDRITVDGVTRYVCPICGELSGAVLRGHGLEHHEWVET